MSFDAGYAADDKAKLGTHAMMLALMDEGTRTRSSIDIAEEQEPLGAVITPEASMDRTDVSLFALTPNLAPSLAPFADIVRTHAFAAGEVVDRQSAGQGKSEYVRVHRGGVCVN